VLVRSISGFLRSKKRIREVEACALLASEAKELAQPIDSAVNTIAATPWEMKRSRSFMLVKIQVCINWNRDS